MASTGRGAGRVVRELQVYSNNNSWRWVVAAQRTVGPGHFVAVGGAASQGRDEIFMGGSGGTAPEHVVAESGEEHSRSRTGQIVVCLGWVLALRTTRAQKTNGTRSLAYPDEGGYSLPYVRSHSAYDFLCGVLPFYFLYLADSYTPFALKYSSCFKREHSL
uniref:Uncharacterized protein n=1 Tax=Oryza barthii TaxID=65489 RepID=A0A0D3FDQ8_9ORYZ